MDKRQTQVAAISTAVWEFANRMLDAMCSAYDQGKIGWDEPYCIHWNGDFEKEILSRVVKKLAEGVKPGDEVDIANYMMMLRHLRRGRVEERG